MTILNEQPGIEARSALKPGTGEGEIDVVVTATDTPLTVYSLKVDNNATQATGKNQIGASISLQNPSGHFDQATLFANASDGVTFVNADYSLAVGERGLRAGVSASSLRYRITETSFEALRGDGSASILSANFSYPLQRLAQRSLTVNASLAQKRITDYAFDLETGNRNLNVGNVGLSGWSVNPWIGGITSYGAELTAGNVDRSANAADMAQDQKGRRTDGHFTKLAWRMGQTVSVAEGWNVLANLRGQVAERNLDSSERLSLGGPANVRAYPVDEAAGDEGYLLSLNLVHPVNETVVAKLFFDYGEITLNKNLWDNWNVGNPGLPNRYALKGIGAGLDWMVAKNTSLSVMLAAPLGDNPGRDSNELDPNAGRKQARFSASLLVNF
jgi:hemolysin activation/secretion protein